MRDDLIRDFTDIYDRFLRDESSEEGSAVTISFPETAQEVSELIRFFSTSEEQGYIIQGGLSGIRGEAVPHDVHIINLSRMNRFGRVYQTEQGDWIAETQPGVTLDDLRTLIARGSGKMRLIWPPAPSEGSASIGGIAASGAFGMNICGCGETADHICALEYVDRCGEIISLTDDVEIRDTLKAFKAGRRGSCITSLSLKLAEEPSVVWGTAFFFESEDDALRFADSLEDFTDPRITTSEYIDEASIRSIEYSRTNLPSVSAVPQVPDGAVSIVYVEIEAADEAEEPEVEELMMEIAEAAAESGADLDTAWAFMGPGETSRFHDFRHAVTESATQKMAAAHANDRELHLISFDIKEKTLSFSELLRNYRKASGEGVKSAVCGSIGSSVLRVIMVPENAEQLRRGKEIRALFMDEGGVI